MRDNHIRKIEMLLALAQREGVFEFSRSSGAGGQNVNKVSSKASLRWNLASSAIDPETLSLLTLQLGPVLNKEGDLLISSEAFRDQIQNRRACIEKLNVLLSKALTPVKKRKPTRPTKSSKRKRLDTKTKHKEKKSSRRRVDY